MENMKIYELNATNRSTTSSTFAQENVIFNHLTVISGLILIFSVVSLSVFIKAPRIATNIRCLCGNIVFYNICFLVVFAIHNMDSSMWYFFRITHHSVMFQLIATTFFSVERLIAINYPFRYRKYLKNSYVKASILLQLILYAAIICFILATHLHTERVIIACWVRTSAHILLTVICFFCSLKALVIFKRSLSIVQALPTALQHRIQHVRRGKAILSVCCLLSVLLHLPLAVEIMIKSCEAKPSHQYSTIYVLLLNTAIDPLIYMWKFRECRLQGLLCLSRLPCFKSMERGIENRRMSILNIPVSENRANVNGFKATTSLQ